MFLFPPSPHEWLPKNHPAYFISELVDLLDLSAFYKSYGGLRGQPPYNPVMMVKVWVYALTKSIHSSRKLERLCTRTSACGTCPATSNRITGLYLSFAVVTTLLWVIFWYRLYAWPPRPAWSD